MWDLNYLLVGIGLQLGRAQHQAWQSEGAGPQLRPMRERTRAGRRDRIRAVVGDYCIAVGTRLKARALSVTTNQAGD
jgi:hypothetical protein